MMVLLAVSLSWWALFLLIGSLVYFCERWRDERKAARTWLSILFFGWCWPVWTGYGIWLVAQPLVDTLSDVVRKAELPRPSLPKPPRRAAHPEAGQLSTTEDTTGRLSKE